MVTEVIITQEITFTDGRASLKPGTKFWVTLDDTGSGVIYFGMFTPVRLTVGINCYKANPQGRIPN